MEDKFERLFKTEIRRGVFGEYVVIGAQYKNSLGATGWQIYAHQLRGYVSSYWIEKEKFYGLKTPIFPNFLNVIQLEILNETVEISDAERKAILGAIAQWENSANNKLDPTV